MTKDTDSTEWRIWSSCHPTGFSSNKMHNPEIHRIPLLNRTCIKLVHSWSLICLNFSIILYVLKSYQPAFILNILHVLNSREKLYTVPLVTDILLTNTIRRASNCFGRFIWITFFLMKIVWDIVPPHDPVWVLSLVNRLSRLLAFFSCTVLCTLTLTSPTRIIPLTT